jgi:4-aminobutyrate aminotransferase-like enzyme
MINIEELNNLESQYCSWGDTVHYNEPIKYFVGCEGSFMLDEKSVRYLDIQMAYSAANFGYKNRFFNNRLIEQLDTLPQIASEYLYDHKVLLSKRINDSIERFTGTKGRVHFNVGGSQAIDDSLKLVSINQGSRKVFAFEGSYHGRTIGASSLTSSYRYRNRYGDFSSRAHFIPFPYVFRSPFYDDPVKAEDYYVHQFERLFESEYQGIVDFKKNETEFIAFYIEPIQGTGGYVIPPPNYFKRIKKILDEFNILLVDDEIQMGFFRTGKMWAIEHFGIKPDIITFGKSLTNGLNPLSGLWAREELINPKKWSAGSTHSTFGSNPLGMVLGMSTFDWIEQSRYLEEIPQKGKYFLERLKVLKENYTVIGDVDGLGLALRVEICFPDGRTPNKELADKIKNDGLSGNIEFNGKKYGLILDVGGYYKNVFTLAPSLEISYHEIDMFFELFERILKKYV